MARTKQTARKSTGGRRPVTLEYYDYWIKKYQEDGKAEELEELKRRMERTRDLVITILGIPELLRQIYRFSGDNNILYFDKTIYLGLTKSVLCLHLNLLQSMKFIASDVFRSKIKDLVEKTEQQLNIDFSGVHLFTHAVKNIDLHHLNSLHSLDLSNQEMVETVDCLKDCFCLNLSNCKRVRDVSELYKLDTLDLSGCEYITDVSMLGNVRKLNLTGCTGIKDFSKLGSVKNLNLSSTAITHTRGLEDVHTLILINCDDLNDITVIHRNKYLRLENNNAISDVSQLKNVECLILKCLTNLSDVTNLCHVSYLLISHCENITEVKGLYNIQTLYLINLPSLEKINVSNSHEMFLIKYDCPSLVKYIFKYDTIVIDNTCSWHYCKSLYYENIEIEQIKRIFLPLQVDKNSQSLFA